MPNLPNIDIQKRLPLIIAVVLGLVAVIFANSYLKQREQEIAARARSREKVAQIVVAKEDIPRGAHIERRMVALQKMPEQSIQPRATSSIERVIDKITIAPISEGEQILLNKLASSAQAFDSLSYHTPPGKRAITIPVDNISSVGGMIRPSDYVDILGVVPEIVKTLDGEQVTRYATVPLFQKVLVLAVGSSLKGAPAVQTKRGERSPVANTITIALSPQETTMIAFVQEQGKLRFILRSPADTEVSQVYPANWDTLFMYLFPERQKMLEAMTQQEPQKIEAPPEVEIYRGTRRELVPLQK